jgi:hypothetical protein
MPNLPISQLPASDALTGAELFADVQGGVTKYTTLDDISAFATSSVMITGSITDHTLTFTKGDSTTFNINLPGGQAGPGEATYLIPKNLTVYDDLIPIREFFLTGSEFNDSSFIKLTWSGSTGTCNVNLPDCTATENVNRIIGFISDSTFTSATHADLRPLSGSGQSLDGSTTQAYRINKDYEGIRVWSDGTEWFIIQKKAQ